MLKVILSFFPMNCWNWWHFQYQLHYFSTFYKFILKNVLCTLWRFWLASSQISWQTWSTLV